MCFTLSTALYRAPFSSFQMWQVFLHLWNQLFYTPASWLLVSVTHTDITHVHTPYLGRLCPYKPDFCPKFKFHWVASTPRRYFELWTSVNWSWMWHQLTCLIFYALETFLHHFDVQAPPPMHFARTCCLFGPMQGTQVLYNWLKIFRVESRQGNFPHPMLE